MASRKLVRDLFLSKVPFYRQLLTFQQVSTSNTRISLLPANGYLGNRQFSVLNEFSKQVKGEANRNQEFQQSVKELQGKAEELKGVTEDLKVRTKQTTEQLYKQVDGAWTEAEATAKKVSANLKEKISAATEEVKGSFGIGKEEDPEFTATSAKDGTDVKNGSKSTSGEEKQQQSSPGDTANTIFGKFKSTVTPKFSVAFQKLKEAKPIDMAKKGYDVVKDELSGNPSKRKRIEYGASSTTSRSTVKKSTRTDITVVPSKQSRWSKKWEALKEKMQGHPIFKRVSGLSEPVVAKSQEFAEDIRDRWDTTDNPVVHKIQDLSENVFGETATALSVKEIRRRDPSFSLPEFVTEVQEVVKPVLNAYFKGDVEVLKKYCSTEVIERCKAEHKAYESQGIFFDNRILHISEVEARETKMMGDTPIIIVAFQTQQVYCVRDRHGAITEGGKDTIHTVYYAWAMQQVDVEELGEGALFPIWRLREMQQLGETKKNNGVPASRSQVWMAAYMKDGTSNSDSVNEVMTQMNELAEHMEGSSTDPAALQEQIFTQVMGPERPGRVRTFGLGPSPTDVFGGGYRRSQEQNRLFQTQVQEQVQEQLHRYQMQFESKMNEVMEKQIQAIRTDFQSRIQFLESQLQAAGVPVDPVVAPSNPLYRQQVVDSLSSHPTVRPMSHQQQSHAFSSQEVHLSKKEKKNKKKKKN